MKLEVIGMIMDQLANAPIYYGLGPRFHKALEWLKQADPSAFLSGQRIDIDGDEIYATLFETETLPPESCKLEYHKNYADIQLVVKGQEAVGYVLNGPVTELEPYDPVLDIGFSSAAWDKITVSQGTFYIVWPQDYHAPRVALDRPQPVVRLVVKVKL